MRVWGAEALLLTIVVIAQPPIKVVYPFPGLYGKNAAVLLTGIIESYNSHYQVLNVRGR